MSELDLSELLSGIGLVGLIACLVMALRCVIV